MKRQADDDGRQKLGKHHVLQTSRLVQGKKSPHKAEAVNLASANNGRERASTR